MLMNSRIPVQILHSSFMAIPLEKTNVILQICLNYLFVSDNKSHWTAEEIIQKCKYGAIHQLVHPG